MTALPNPEDVFDALETSWPAARMLAVGPWLVREGQGGGKRVSAVTAERDFAASDLSIAESEQAKLGQALLFMVRDGENLLDDLLASHGYEVVDPVTLYAVPVAGLAARELPQLAAFHLYPPLGISTELWARGGIGPARLGVMDRCVLPKTTILARNRDHPAGVAFVARDREIAMIHAIEVSPEHRRNSVGTNILISAAKWAQNNGAKYLTLAVTRANSGANALYTSLGMTVVGHYHYRIKPMGKRPEQK